MMSLLNIQTTLVCFSLQKQKHFRKRCQPLWKWNLVYSCLHQSLSFVKNTELKPALCENWWITWFILQSASSASCDKKPVDFCTLKSTDSFRDCQEPGSWLPPIDTCVKIDLHSSLRPPMNQSGHLKARENWHSLSKREFGVESESPRGKTQFAVYRLRTSVTGPLRGSNEQHLHRRAAWLGPLLVPSGLRLRGDRQHSSQRRFSVCVFSAGKARKRIRHLPLQLIPLGPALCLNASSVDQLHLE